jgi:hypothetical protein
LPGLVLRYDYLSSHEAAAGRDQGKDRPACLVAASDSQTRPRFVVLLPITPTPPDGETIGIEIPATVKQAIGLDDVRSFVIVSGHTIDEWPNAGVSPIPGKPGIFGYTMRWPVTTGIFRTSLYMAALSVASQWWNSTIRPKILRPRHSRRLQFCRAYI